MLWYLLIAALIIWATVLVYRRRGYVLEVDLDNREERLRAAAWLIDEDEVDEAEDMLRKAIEQSKGPKNGWAYVRASVDLASMLASQGRWHEAVKLYSVVGDAVSTNLLEEVEKVELHAEWSQLLHALGRDDESEGVLRQVMDKAQSPLAEALAREALADFLLSMGRLDEALAEAQESFIALRGAEHDRAVSALLTLAAARCATQIRPCLPELSELDSSWLPPLVTHALDRGQRGGAKVWKGVIDELLEQVCNHPEFHDEANALIDLRQELLGSSEA